MFVVIEKRNYFLDMLDMTFKVLGRSSFFAFASILNTLAYWANFFCRGIRAFANVSILTDLLPVSQIKTVFL